MDLLAAASTGVPSVNIYFLAAFMAVATGIFMFWEWMRKRHKKFIEETVEDELNTALTGFSEDLMKKIETVIREKVDTAYRRIKEDFLDPLDRRVIAIETKIDVVWQSISIDMARILHHPEPTRLRVDELLDILMAGTLTQAEANELSQYLSIIRDWEPGQDAPFTVFQGEQVAAAILLHTMEYVTES